MVPITAVGPPGPAELLIILAIVLLIFGTSKLKGLGKGLGTSIREFKQALNDDDDSETTSESGKPAGNDKPAATDA